MLDPFAPNADADDGFPSLHSARTVVGGDLPRGLLLLYIVSHFTQPERASLSTDDSRALVPIQFCSIC